MIHRKLLQQAEVSLGSLFFWTSMCHALIRRGELEGAHKAARITARDSRGVLNRVVFLIPIP
jgi:hypothetical protein